MKAFRRLRIEDALLRTGIKPHGYISRAWDTGETMYEIVFDAQNETRFGGPYLNIHRGDLHAILESGRTPETIAFGHRSSSFKRQAISASHFSERRACGSEMVIGADGINSTVRNSCWVTNPRVSLARRRIAQSFPPRG